MAQKRKYAPIERLRRGVLLGFLIFLGAVLGIYMAGRSRRAQPEMALREGATRGREEVVLAGEGFEYQMAEGDERPFKIRAERIVSDRDNQVVLEEVEIEIERAGRSPYLVTSDRATYVWEGSVASLEGHVRVRTDDGMELRADGLRMTRKGRALESTSAVEFRLGPGYSGRADELFYLINRERLRLAGNVVIRGHGERHGRLRCQQLHVERQERLVRAEGDVDLRSGASFLRANRLSITLEEDEQTVQFVHVAYGVSGRFRRESGNDQGTSVEFNGEELSVKMAAGEYDLAELTGDRRAAAQLTTREDSGFERRIDAPYMMADFEAGTPAIVRAYSGVTIGETIAFRERFPVRRACAEWALASFSPDGVIEELVLQNEVDYQAQGIQARGDRVRAVAADSGPGDLSFTGTPAHLATDRGLLEAPSIRHGGEAGVTRALEGVRAELPAGGRFSLPGDGADRGPILLTSQEAGWRREPSEFRFIGKVRAWQGESFLLADELIGDEAGDRLRAEGRVKTVIKPRRGAGAELEAQPAAEAATAPSAPIEVTAETMTYRRSTRLLNYSGAVQAHETGRTIRCDDLDALMGEANRFERLICRGNTVIENPDRGQTVRGKRAEYVPGSEQVLVEGAPVEMRNLDGAVLRGTRILYRLDSGVAQVTSGPLAPASESPEPEGE